MHDEKPLAANRGSGFLPDRFVRRDERGQHNNARVVEELGHFRAAAEILAPLVGGEAKIFADSATHVLPVENNNRAALIEQPSLEGISKRRLAAASQPGEQNGNGL